MMGIGFPELMVILVIIMIIFGAGKLPQIGSAFGNSIRNFKTSMKEAEEMDAASETEEAPQPAAEQPAGTTVRIGRRFGKKSAHPRAGRGTFRMIRHGNAVLQT